MVGRIGGKKAPKKNGYKMPDPIPRGEILTDLSKKQWIIGESIGVGGFGEIYSAAQYSGKAPKDYNAVIKIEPHGNGPLFVEMHFYMRNAKPDDIEAWRKKKKLSHLGMPKFVGSGSHECHNTKYRFVVMDRYGMDLWKLFLENGRRFPEATVYKIALQIIDVLEYIHSRTYIHADIKGANLLLDFKSKDLVYLVDFGLASHYTTKPEYKLDPKKAHNGTMEYTSRDAHMGVPTMRSDLEILGYNIIQWLCSELPWENNLKDSTAVQRQKEKAFENIPAFLKQCFSVSTPAPITSYMKLLANLKFNDTPDYDKFRKILIKGLEDLGSSADGKLDFSGSGKVTEKPAKPALDPRKIKKTTKTATPVASRKRSPRVKVIKSPSPCRSNPASLDESTLEIVVDKKREGIRGMRKIVESMEDNSDAEYDIYIAKKRKKGEEKPVAKAATPKKRGRKKAIPTIILDFSAGSEPEESTPKYTRSRTKVAAATKMTTRNGAQKVTEEPNTDEDMFADDDM